MSSSQTLLDEGNYSVFFLFIHERCKHSTLKITLEGLEVLKAYNLGNGGAGGGGRVWGS